MITNFTILKAFSSLFILMILVFAGPSVKAQCPSNIDFEDGTFNGWVCYTGSVAAVGTTNVITLNPVPGPIANRHTMLSSFPGDGLDQYGNFPKNCPNGSGHSIKLGNNTGGHEAEGVSYTFTIPATSNKFSLIYYYAVVFQNPGHQPYQQPRLEITVDNLTDNTTVGCSSFSFVAAGGLPGFFTSPSDASVSCKDWSATSINLDGNAGKTIRLFFKTADCTFMAHFGYAYIDVNTECSSSFVGASYCPDDTAINVRAPYGYQGYTWWDNTFSQILGTSQILHLAPAPSTGTTVAVQLTPYNGYGCLDTLYAQLLDTLTIVANAGPDKLACNNNPAQLGVAPTEGFVYSWNPILGLSNPNISNPIAAPTYSTTYVLTVKHDGGGCISTDTVLVNAGNIDSTLTLIGSASYCAGSGSGSILRVNITDSIQWFQDNVAIPGATQTQYTVTQTGDYYAMLFSNTGCSLPTRIIHIDVYPSPTASFSINTADQCLSVNQYVLTNSSVISAGAMTYSWDLGDGTITNTTNVTHSYTSAGTYLIKLDVSAAGNCVSSSQVTVHVFPSPDTTLTLIGSTSYCVGRTQNAVLKVAPTGTIQWFKDNIAIAGANQTLYTVTQTGAYYAVLTNGFGCTVTTPVKQIDVYPSPVIGFAVNTQVQCFKANQFVFTNNCSIAAGTLQYRWDLGDGTFDTTVNITHSYNAPGTYNVRLSVIAAGGCNGDSSITVTVYPTPLADFTANPECVNLRIPILNTTFNNTTSTLNYLWDFGNGTTSTLAHPVYSYSLPGTYVMKLTVSSAQCPLSLDTKQYIITIDAPAQGITYPDQAVVMNFPTRLTARSIGTSILWSPATSLNNPKEYNPIFEGLLPQAYTVQFTTAHGCITVDTVNIKTVKKIAIYVPTGFSPNGDGINDFLRPTLTGFKSVNYFRVYNRWGKLIFQMSGDRPGWDGRVNQVPQDSQVFVWTIEAIDVDGIVHQEHGTTVLIR